jgi:hypothetical protein
MSMAKLHFASAGLLLFVALGLLPVACSSKDDRSLVVLDLRVATDVAIPASVRLSAFQASEVRSVEVTWTKPGSRTLQIGFFIPSGVSGQVTITAKAYDSNGLAIAEGQLDQLVDLKVGGSVGPFTLVLGPATVGPPVGDGGVDGAEVGDTRLPDVALDGAQPEAQGLDVTVADGPGQAEVTLPIDGEKDVPSLPEAGDAVTTSPADTAEPQPEVADTVVARADGGDAPADVITDSEVGHTPAWEPAQNIENDAINPSFEPVIVVDPVSEHVYVAWDEATAVKVKRWNRATATWEPTITVETRGDPVSPAIGVDGSGNVLLLWGQNTGAASVDGVWVSRTTDGSSWSPAARITADPSFEVRLAVARNGTAHAVYNKQQNGWPLYTAYYDGVGWTENPTTLYPNTTFYDSDARLALSGTGDGLLVFRKDWGIAGTVLTGQSFSTPTMLDPNYETVTAYDQSIAINRKGQGMVVWTEASGSNTLLLGRTYDPGLGWSSVMPPIVTAQTVEATAVALDEQNSATLLWQQNTTGGANLVAMHGSPTGPWGEVTALETDNIAGKLGLTTERAQPSVAIDTGGNVLAVWRKEVSASATTFGAYATRYAGGSWLPQAKLGLKTGLDIGGLSVSVADSGFGAATFFYLTDSTPSDPDAYNVFVAFFR